MWKCALSACLLAASVPAGAETLHNVRTYEAPDHTRVVFDTSGQATTNIFALTDPDRLVIDFRNSRPATDFSPDFSNVTGRRLQKVRMAARGGDYRVVLDLVRPLRRKDFWLKPIPPYNHRLVIDLFDQQAAPTARQPSQPQTHRDIVIAIDAGHGGEDPGAIGPNRVAEKQVVLSMAKKLAALFEGTPDYRVVMVRKGDYYIPLRRRTRIAHEARAHLFLSIHADAFKRPDVSGASVYMLSERGADSETARFLAERENQSDLIGGVGDVSLDDKDPYLRETLTDLAMEGKRRQSSEVGVEVLNRLSRVTKLHKKQVGHAGFVVLKTPDIPSLLVETGFISNPSEARRLNQAEHQGKITRAIYDGVVKYWRENPPPGTALAKVHGGPNANGPNSAGRVPQAGASVQAGLDADERRRREAALVAAIDGAVRSTGLRRRSSPPGSGQRPVASPLQAAGPPPSVRSP